MLADFRHPDVADDIGRDRSRRRFRAIEVGVGTGGRPWRDQCCIGADVERRFLARSACRGLRRLCRRRAGGLRRAEFLGAELRRQSVPAELRLDAIGPRTRHCAPIVDAAGRAGRNAGHAEVADVRIDDIVTRVVGDRADRAGRLAGVATDADFWIDQMLPDDLGLGRSITPGSSRTPPSRPCRRP